MLMFMEAMLSITYDSPDMNELKNKIQESHERSIEIALEEIVNEIYSR